MNNRVNYPPHIWQQLKALTAKELIEALKKDPRWEFKGVRKNKYVFYNTNNPPSRQEIVIHYHPKKGGYGSSLLKSILTMIEWSEEDLRKLKLIK